MNRTRWTVLSNQTYLKEKIWENTSKMSTVCVTILRIVAKTELNEEVALKDLMNVYNGQFG